MMSKRTQKLFPTPRPRSSGRGRALQLVPPSNQVLTSTPRRENDSGSESRNWEISTIPGPSGLHQTNEKIGHNLEDDDDDYEEFTLTPLVASLITDFHNKQKCVKELEHSESVKSGIRSCEDTFKKAEDLITKVKLLNERQKLIETIDSELKIFKDPKFRACVDKLDKKLVKFGRLLKLENVCLDTPQNGNLEQTLADCRDESCRLAATLSEQTLETMLSMVKQFGTKFKNIQDNSEKVLIESFRLQRLAVHEASLKCSVLALKDHISES